MSPILLPLLNLAVLAVIVLVLLELRRLVRAQHENGLERRQVRQLQEVLSAMPDPVLVLDSKGRCVEGHPAASDKGPALLHELPEPQRAALYERVATAIKQDQACCQRMALDGRSVMAQIVPLVGGGDQAAVWLRDFTDQEASTTRAGKLATRNRAILRSAMDGFFVVDESYRFVEVNDSFCRMTGYSSDELLQMKITDLEVKEPANRRADVSPLRTGLHQFATAHRHRDGHIIRLETSVIVLRDDDRKILVGFARDVTDRLRDQERLEQLSRQNKLILDCAAEGIYGVDLEGRISFANPAAARMLGWEVHELIGMCAHELLRHGRAQPAPLLADGCPICEAVRGGIVRQGADALFRRKDGTEFPVDFVSSPIRQHGQLTGAVVVFRDTSERKRAENERRQLEARIQQAQKLESLGMLAGGLAHDFNNLLLSVLCNASLAMECLPQHSDAHGFLDRIVKSGRRASELTRQMLAYAGHARYDVQPLALNPLVEEIADLMRAALPKQVKLDLQLAPDLPLVEGDASQLQQILMNLFMNGSEAIGPQAGTVCARTYLRTMTAAELAGDYIGHGLAPGAYVCLEVTDTGCGMGPAVLARIFDPFFTTKTTGRGLGLSALLGIVRSHHGAVRVSSALGQGTTFTLLFPPAARNASQDTLHQPVTELPAGATVLVIDDEEDIREVVQAVLESRGARVLTAKDGAAGIEQFRRSAGDINVVLLDMTMPGIGGEAVLEEILSIRPSARVLLSSGFGEEQTLSRLRDRRAAGFVPKPYTAQALVDRIGAALNSCDGQLSSSEGRLDSSDGQEKGMMPTVAANADASG
jgi:two-component system cell cycle sensor histidine kinase/response regulator CckA